MDWLISFLPGGKYFDQFKQMATSSQLTVENNLVGNLNKLQRYACLHKCAANISSPEEAKEIEALIQEERKRDYSDTDETEYIKYQGAIPLRSHKVNLLDSIVRGEAKVSTK